MQKKNILFILACALFFVLVSCSAEPTENEVKERVEQFFVSLQTDSMEDVVHTYGEKQWKKDVSLETIEENVQLDQETTFDSFEVEQIKQTEDSRAIVDGHINFSEVRTNVRVVFTPKLEVSSLEFQTSVSHIPFPETIIEEDITIGQETEFPLDGKITLPKDAEGDIPAVVLVHGSGSTDYDETAYAYKPFRDIAWALAEQGIASIRYDKRTFVYGNDAYSEGPEKMNVEEETIDDALLAFDVLLADERIDAENVFIIGHSLGGMLAPRIAVNNEEIAGIISLAGSPRTLSEIIFDQQQFILDEQSLPESVHEQQQQEIDHMRKETEETLALPEEDIRSAEVLGFPGYYLWEMEQHPVEEIIGSLDIPIYILQGDEDFQVFKEIDYTMWKKLLSDYEQATFSSYPNLNHFFIETNDESLLESYEQPGVVSGEVLDDIATWIHEQ